MARKGDSGVYQITNVLTGERYVGSTTNTATRWSWHTDGLRKNRHHNSRLQAPWNEHGAAAFQYSLLERVEPVRDSLYAREQVYLDALRPEFNVHPLAESARGSLGKASWGKGKHLSAEHRAKLSAAHMGKPTWNKGKLLSDQHRASLKKAWEHRARREPWNKRSEAAPQ